jgi:hypothetical protein
MNSLGKKEEYQRNKEGYFRRARKSYAKTFQNSEQRLHRILVEAKSRAKKRGIPFEITSADVVWNDVCPVLKIPITIQRNKGRGGDDNSPSLDRIDNGKGYVPGNVRIISNRANKLKNTMTKEECALLLKNWDQL